jgi:hypothetical protein
MPLTEGEIEKLVVEIHSTVAVLAERQIAASRVAEERQTEIAAKLDGVITRQDKTNGTVAAINHKQTLQDGAMAVLRWQAGITIGIVSAGAGVAGVVLAIVAKGG